MLDGGANPNEVDAFLVPVLNHVAGRGNEALFDMLIQAGADPHGVDSTGRDALQMAMYVDGCEGLIEKLVALEAGLEFARNDQQGQNISRLQLAASEGATSNILTMLRLGARLEAESKTYGTALHLAIKNGHVGSTLALLDAGADIHKKDPEGDSALAMAEDNKHPEVLQAVKAWMARDAARLAMQEMDAHPLLAARP